MQAIRSRTLHAVGIVLLMLTSFTASPREAAGQDAAAFISNLGAQGLQALSSSRPAAQQEARFRQLLDENFDLTGIGRFVLGPYVRTMSPGAYPQYQALFRDYLVQVYTARLGRYADSPFRVVGARPGSDQTVVLSQVSRDGSSPIQIDWHVANHSGRWLVTDVVVDGVSMKATQRSEFASIIQRNGGQADALVAALRQQLAQAR